MDRRLGEKLLLSQDICCTRRNTLASMTTRTTMDKTVRESTALFLL